MCKNMDSKEENSACEKEKRRILCQQLKFDDAYSSAFGIKSTSLIGRFVAFESTNFVMHPFMKKNHLLWRYLVAERDFEEGELIFQENALAVGPNPESTLQCILCSKKVFSIFFSIFKASFLF